MRRRSSAAPEREIEDFPDVEDRQGYLECNLLFHRDDGRS
jgi:hypothetical protein